MVSIRYNESKAGSTTFGHSTVNDWEDMIEGCNKCYDLCGCTGVAILTLATLGLGLAMYASGADFSNLDKHCFEVCSFDESGFAFCSCLFG